MYAPSTLFPLLLLLHTNPKPLRGEWVVTIMLTPRLHPPGRMVRQRHVPHSRRLASDMG